MTGFLQVAIIVGLVGLFQIASAIKDLAKAVRFHK